MPQSCKVLHNVAHLYLRPVAGRHIGDGPTGLFADGFFRAGQEVQQARQGGAVKDHLRLDVVAGHNVAHGTQPGGHDTLRGVPGNNTVSNQIMMHSNGRIDIDSSWPVTQTQCKIKCDYRLFQVKEGIKRIEKGKTKQVYMRLKL